MTCRPGTTTLRMTDSVGCLGSDQLPDCTAVKREPMLVLDKAVGEGEGPSQIQGQMAIATRPGVERETTVQLALRLQKRVKAIDFRMRLIARLGTYGLTYEVYLDGLHPTEGDVEGVLTMVNKTLRLSTCYSKKDVEWMERYGLGVVNEIPEKTPAVRLSDGWRAKPKYLMPDTHLHEGRAASLRLQERLMRYCLTEESLDELKRAIVVKAAEAVATDRREMRDALCTVCNLPGPQTHCRVRGCRALIHWNCWPAHYYASHPRRPPVEEGLMRPDGDTLPLPEGDSCKWARCNVFCRHIKRCTLALGHGGSEDGSWHAFHCDDCRERFREPPVKPPPPTRPPPGVRDCPKALCLSPLGGAVSCYWAHVGRAHPAPSTVRMPASNSVEDVPPRVDTVRDDSDCVRVACKRCDRKKAELERLDEGDLTSSRCSPPCWFCGEYSVEICAACTRCLCAECRYGCRLCGHWYCGYHIARNNHTPCRRVTPQASTGHGAKRPGSMKNNAQTQTAAACTCK